MRKLLFLALISAVLSLPAAAQSLEQTLARADSFLKKNQPAEAVKLYERGLFFAPDNQKPGIYRSLGKAYFGSGNYVRSYEAYSNAIDVPEADSADYDILIEKLRAELWGRNYSRAERTLSLLDTGRYPSFREQRIFYTGVLFYSAEDFDLAETEFLKLAKGDADKTDEISRQFRKLRRSERRSPKAAMLMSLLLPGSGQVYAGRTEDGINALVLNGAWLALTVVTWEIYGPYQALATAFPWFLRYYSGAAENAAVLTFKMKEERRDKVYRKVLELISQLEN